MVHLSGGVRANENPNLQLSGRVHADEIHEVDSSFETVPVTDVNSSTYFPEAVFASDKPLKRDQRY
jgi:hypothetical protein